LPGFAGFFIILLLPQIGAGWFPPAADFVGFCSIIVNITDYNVPVLCIFAYLFEKI